MSGIQIPDKATGNLIWSTHIPLNITAKNNNIFYKV